MYISSKSILDVIYAKTNKGITSFVHKITMSDHYLVEISSALHYRAPKKKTIEGRSYKNYSLEAAKDFYNKKYMGDIFDIHDVNMIWDKLYQSIRACANTLCPLKSMKVRETNPPWITQEIQELIKERDELFYDGIITNQPSLIIKAKEKRTEAKRVIRNARANYIRSELHKHKSNPRKFWAEMNKLIKNKEKQNIIELMNDQNEKISNSNLPGHINAFFHQYLFYHYLVN